MVAELRSRNGEPQFAVLHGELEDKFRMPTEKRLQMYAHQLALEYDNPPILSAAIFRRGGPKAGIEKREVVSKFRGYVTNRFYYVAFSLSRSLAEEYVNRPQAVAAALAALMRSKIWDRVEQKIRCYEAVKRADVDDERRYLLANVADNYLELDEGETARFNAEIGTEERQEVGKMIQTLSEAKADCRAEGGLTATRKAIVHLARSIHKTLSDGFEEKLNAVDDLERLFAILEQVPKVRSLDEIVFKPSH